MRLINVETLQLHSFSHYETPPYIILSHTWGQEEISLQEWEAVAAFPELVALRDESGIGPDSYSILQERRVQGLMKKQGFVKVTMFCERVKNTRAAIKWVWVDSCCIDKTSSAELSEAINSMFQWYKRSVECWVHLADASLSDDGVDTTAPLEKSRWFNRGWTLQELIAPNHVHFFSYEWTLIGILDDDAFRDRVSKLTGISTSYLGVNNDNYPVNHASVSHRMTWAANRETTVPEDLAYCLLGLFDVNMPLLYGEGRERAFIRLQEEILKQSEDQTLLAWGME